MKLPNKCIYEEIFGQCDRTVYFYNFWKNGIDGYCVYHAKIENFNKYSSKEEAIIRIIMNS